MNSKKAWIVAVGIVIAIIAVSVVLYFHERSSYYDIRADWERIEGGEYAYLIDPSSLSAADFPSWCEDFLSVPGRQYFAFDDADLGNDEGFHDSVYICDDPDTAMMAGEIFAGKILTLANEEFLRQLDITATEHVTFENVIGGLYICFSGARTYVIAEGEYGESVCFVINEALKNEWETLWVEMEPHCKKDLKENLYNELIYWNE